MEITAEVLHLFLYGRLERRMDYFLEERSTIVGDFQDKFAPKEIRILPSSIPGEKLGVFSTCLLKKGTEMGPFSGRMLSRHPDRRFHVSANAWEILDENGTLIAYIDGGRHPTKNWLVYVQCARTDREQNLEVIQKGSNVYYRATRDIKPREELLVWYGKAYSMYMGMPFSKNNPHPVKPVDKDMARDLTNCEEIPENQVEGKWRCVLCKRGFNSRSNLRSHMRIHTLEKPFICQFCGRKFSQSSTLRNHVRLHTGEKPYKCVRCKSSYSQLAGLRAHERSSTHKPSTSVTETKTVINVVPGAVDSDTEPSEIEVSG